MSKQTIFPYPAAKDLILGGAGFLLGFFSPTVLFTMLGGLKNNQFIQEWAIGKMSILERAKSVANLNAKLSSFSIFIIALFLILYAVKKGASIIYTIGVGFLFGICVRFLLMGVLGVSVPLVNNPANQTINGTI